MPFTDLDGQKESFFFFNVLGHKRSGVVVGIVHFRFYENALYIFILGGLQSVAKFAFFFSFRFF